MTNIQNDIYGTSLDKSYLSISEGLDERKEFVNKILDIVGEETVESLFKNTYITTTRKNTELEPIIEEELNKTIINDALVNNSPINNPQINNLPINKPSINNPPINNPPINKPSIKNDIQISNEQISVENRILLNNISANSLINNYYIPTYDHKISNSVTSKKLIFNDNSRQVAYNYNKNDINSNLIIYDNYITYKTYDISSWTIEKCKKYINDLIFCMNTIDQKDKLISVINLFFDFIITNMETTQLSFIYNDKELLHSIFRSLFMYLLKKQVLLNVVGFIRRLSISLRKNPLVEIHNLYEKNFYAIIFIIEGITYTFPMQI